MTGKQVRLFLADGTPGGLTTAEITNWTGHVLAAQRSDIGELLARDEAKRTGVYVLLGEDENEVGGVRAYIGEVDVVGQRLKSHAKEKDFWDRVVTVTSKDANLTKAHCRYLESRLIAIANEAGRVTVENGTNPPDPRLPEADRSDMEYFIEQLHVVLPVLGVNAFRTRKAAPRSRQPGLLESPVFTLLNRKRNVDARAQEIDGEFTVLAGSRVFGEYEPPDGAHADTTARQYASRSALYNKLLTEGAIGSVDGVPTVLRDIPFSSPSAAGSVVQGVGACNGRTAWANGALTFGEWETRDIS